jgi:hypothetical protein
MFIVIEATTGWLAGWHAGHSDRLMHATKKKHRAQRLEFLDEVEEWQMLMGHYCYVTASRGALLGSFLRGVEGFEERCAEAV